MPEHVSPDDLDRRHHIRLIVLHTGSVSSDGVRAVQSGSGHCQVPGLVFMQLRQAGLTWQVVGEELVILDLDGSVYLKLNGSARLLWEHLAQSCTHSELVDALVEKYAVEEQVAAADVTAFLSELDRRGLLGT